MYANVRELFQRAKKDEAEARRYASEATAQYAKGDVTAARTSYRKAVGLWPAFILSEDAIPNEPMPPGKFDLDRLLKYLEGSETKGSSGSLRLKCR